MCGNIMMLHPGDKKTQRPVMWSRLRFVLIYFHVQSYQVNPEYPISAAGAAVAIHMSRG